MNGYLRRKPALWRTLAYLVLSGITLNSLLWKDWHDARVSYAMNIAMFAFFLILFLRSLPFAYARIKDSVVRTSRHTGNK